MSRSTLITYAALAICTAIRVSNAGAIDWTNPYVADFNAGGVVPDSYAHSLFWSKDMTPLPEAYLYYDETGDGGVVFVEDETEQKSAELCYAFTLPSGQIQRTVTGTIEVMVSFPNNAYLSRINASGELSYETSPNGMTWSIKTWLGEGYHQIDVDCPNGTCYIRFAGRQAMINYLRASQRAETPTVWVLPYDPSYGVLQNAIDLAQNGDIIEAQAGTYSGSIDFKGKSITLRSASGPQATFINCVGTNRGVYLHGGAPVLAGFTIQGGRVSAEVPPILPPTKTGPDLKIGGGIYIESGSPTIANCTIKDCTAGIGGGICVAAGAQPLIIGCAINTCTAVRGGGIGLLAGSNATIIDCMIDRNTLTGTGSGAGLGGGLYCLGGEATFSGCRIGYNTTGALTGGGVYCSGSSVVFGNSLIVGNRANAASGLYATQSSVELTNCTIAQNVLNSGGTGGGVYSINGAGVSISNSIIWGNGGTPVVSSGSGGISVEYSDIEGGYGGSTNQNPLFVSATDFHLQSTSKCIDAGDPSTSPAVEPNPSGDRIDMGAYGGSPQAAKGASHTIYHVAATDSLDANGWGLTKDRPFATIKYAVGKAQNGDTVLIWPGTYTLNTSSDEIILNGKAIRIQSAADPAIITALDGYAFSFYNCEGSTTVLSNLIIRGCGEGAIFCNPGSPTLKNLTIVDNPCGVRAEGNSAPHIVNCIFWKNSADIFQCYDVSYSLVDKKLNGKAISDPLFADPKNGDYHLKSTRGRYVPPLGSWTDPGYDKVSSPCIDAGDWREYPRAEPMPNGFLVDMGAHGGTPYASLSPSN
jgi:hypothetical protein